MSINKLIEEQIASGKTVEEAKEEVKNMIDSVASEPNTSETLDQIKECLKKGDTDGAKVILNIHDQDNDESEEDNETPSFDGGEEKNKIKEEEKNLKTKLEKLEDELIKSKMDRETKHALTGALNDIFKMITGDK